MTTKQQQSAGKPGRRPVAAIPRTVAEAAREPVRWERDRRRPDCVTVEEILNSRGRLWHHNFPAAGGVAAFDGPLAGTPKPAHKRLELIIVCAGFAADDIDFRFKIEPDRDLSGALTGVVITRPGASERLPLELSGRFVNIDGEHIGLNWRDAGPRFLAALSQRAAAVLGAPVRTLH